MVRKLVRKIQTSSLGLRVAHLRDDLRGVAAVEFAFVVPILLVCYMGTMEIGRGISVNKKVGRAASIIADLISQEGTMSRAKLDDYLKAAKLIQEPYTRYQMTVTATGIYVDNNGVAKAEWSRRVNNGTFSSPIGKGTVVSIPADLNVEETFLVRVEATMDYVPVMVWVLRDTGGKISMAETYFNRARNPGAQNGKVVECGDC